MKKDLLGILGLCIGLFGIVLTIYFYERTKKEKEPTFIVDPIRLEILNTARTKEAPIKIFTPDGNEIRSDLTSMTFYFWNKGSDPILSTDILKNVIFKLDRNVKIIDYKIIKSSRDVCNLKLIKINDNTLALNFHILERNDGLTAQIIYEGEKESNLSISSTIIGVKEISSFSLSQYRLIGKVILNIGIGIFMIFVILVGFGISSSSGSEMPDYMTLRESTKYKEDKDFQYKVNELEQAIENVSNIRDKIYGRVHNEPSRQEIENKMKRKKFWARLGVTIGIIIVLIILTITWYMTKQEVVDNPIQYIPNSIKP
ncbi:hypothetical protein SAMN05421823_102266 [Catalinimonas alkaloidigena]|uniref:Uncharacterized protein n=1 Tax=Catalinimonas alkaloidigena TaxID=1075417 RepID=A0A1G9ADS1_9BACT|nr:hypothetical protein [Catalinimonas alkaloidigena]SDK25542.1 hypothetical protein SAMN05421823_102266 [Catalinimonas alkaloidigena]